MLRFLFNLLGIQFCSSVFYEDYIPKADFYRNNQLNLVPNSKPKVFESISNISNPSNVLLFNDHIFISLFHDNKILLGSMMNRTVASFAAGSYCTKNNRGSIVCGIVDGPTGMLTHDQTLYVSSFGSDQILMFSLQNHNFGSFIDAFGDSEYLDCPEGLALDSSSNLLYVVNYNSNNIVVYNMSTQQYVKEFVSFASSGGYLSGPECIVYDPISRLFVVTAYFNNSVLFYNHDGNLVKVIDGFINNHITSISNNRNVDNKWGMTRFEQKRQKLLTPGSGVYRLDGPTGIAITPRNTFAISLYKV